MKRNFKVLLPGFLLIVVALSETANAQTPGYPHPHPIGPSYPMEEVTIGYAYSVNFIGPPKPHEIVMRPVDPDELHEYGPEDFAPLDRFDFDDMTLAVCAAYQDMYMNDINPPIAAEDSPPGYLQSLGKFCRNMLGR